MAQATRPRTAATHNPALAVFSAVAATWVFVLVALGAFTTTIGAGMAFPDWPLSNGSVNPHGWLTNVNMFAEHSHRLSATVMGLLTAILAAWLLAREERPWLRKLGCWAFALVVAQGIVGGLRVLLDSVELTGLQTSLGQVFAMLHACLAQAMACVLIAIALSLSKGWLDRPAPASRSIRRASLACCAVIFVQLGVAAVMRHSFAGLAIPTFPWSAPGHHLLPSIWNFKVAINFTHRAIALVIAVLVIVTFASVLRDPTSSRPVRAAASLLALLVILQIWLGAEIILTYRSVIVTTAHVLVGALTLVTAFSVAWLAHRDAIEGGAQDA